MKPFLYAEKKERQSQLIACKNSVKVRVSPRVKHGRQVEFEPPAISLHCVVPRVIRKQLVANEPIIFRKSLKTKSNDSADRICCSLYPVFMHKDETGNRDEAFSSQTKPYRSYAGYMYKQYLQYGKPFNSGGD